jgi:hypothetical protein
MDKKKIARTKRRLRYLCKRLADIGPIMRGTVVLLGTKCGNPRCKCAKGEKHQQYYFSVNVDKKTKLMFLGKTKKAEAETYLRNYELLWDIVEEMTLLNFELLKSK